MILVICGSVWFLLNGFHGLCVARLWSCGGELFLAGGFLVRNLGVHRGCRRKEKGEFKKEEGSEKKDKEE